MPRLATKPDVAECRSGPTLRVCTGCRSFPIRSAGVALRIGSLVSYALGAMPQGAGSEAQSLWKLHFTSLVISPVSGFVSRKVPIPGA